MGQHSVIARNGKKVQERWKKIHAKEASMSPGPKKRQDSDTLKVLLLNMVINHFE